MFKVNDKVTYVKRDEDIGCDAKLDENYRIKEVDNDPDQRACYSLCPIDDNETLECEWCSEDEIELTRDYYLFIVNDIIDGFGNLLYYPRSLERTKNISKVLKDETKNILLGLYDDGNEDGDNFIDEKDGVFHYNNGYRAYMQSVKTLTRKEYLVLSKFL